MYCTNSCTHRFNRNNDLRICLYSKLNYKNFRLIHFHVENVILLRKVGRGVAKNSLSLNLINYANLPDDVSSFQNKSQY